MFEPILVIMSVACSTSAVFFLIVALTPLVDRITLYQVGKLGSRYRQLGYPEEGLSFLLRIWVLLIATALLGIGVLLKMPPFAIAIAAIIYLSPRKTLDILIRRRARTLRDQTTVVSVAMANAVKSGLSPAQALEEVAVEAPLPIQNEIKGIVSDYQNGRSLGDAISDRRKELNHDSFTLFALTIETVVKQGGNLAACLSGLSKSLQEEKRLQGKLECDTASGRQTVLLLSLFPAVFLVMSWFLIQEGTILLFTTFSGQCVLAGIVGLIYAGYSWASHILKFDI